MTKVDEIYKLAENKTKDELIYLLVTSMRDYEARLQEEREEAVRGFVEYQNKGYQDEFKIPEEDVTYFLTQTKGNNNE